MDENLYDDFGNYIGPDLYDEDEEAEEELAYDELEEDRQGLTADGQQQKQDTVEVIEKGDSLSSMKQVIVLHEDKQYYPDAETVYGPSVKVTVQEEDTQNISEPIVQPERFKRHDHTEHHGDSKTSEWYPTEFGKEFMEGLMSVPELVRHVAVIGHLHHGKTVFLDMLVRHTHRGRIKLGDTRKERFTDSRYDEQERGISIKSTPISLILSNVKEKDYLINFMDTPGHPNFFDEVTAAIRICDGALVVVDVVEGLTPHLESLIQHVIQERLDLTFVINQIDRLILELKLPLVDAYHKIRHVLEEINLFVSSIPNSFGGEPTDTSMLNGDVQFKPRFSPEYGNVIFASGEHEWSFSLLQFAKLYADIYRTPLPYDQFARRLWGSIYYHSDTRSFSTRPPESPSTPPTCTFVQFVLEPIYKIYAQVVGEEVDRMAENLQSLNIHLTKSEMKLNVRPLLNVVMRSFFKGHHGLVDMLVSHIASPVAAASRKVAHIYRGPSDSFCARAMEKCDADGPLMIHISKLYPDRTSDHFNAFGRIFSGRIRQGDRVRVLGETYGENEEDTKLELVKGVFTYNARYYIRHVSLSAGNWVALDGVDDLIVKTATITAQVISPKMEKYDIFCPLRFSTLSVIKIAVEPLNPSELPKLVEGLRKVNKTYPLLVTRVEESGERIILGTGEMYLDSVMYDLRKVFTDIEIKVAEPVVVFSETVVETSSIKCYAETPNKMNRLTMIAEPLEKGLATDIESGKIQWNKTPSKSLRHFLKTQYKWDTMAAVNIWAFGPEPYSPNILINDTLPDEVCQKKLIQVQDHIIRGFNWATREGPLCEDPIRNTKFKLIHANISDEPIQRNGTQIIPTSRRVAYSAFLTATPRLMEPVYSVYIIAPYECLSAIDRVLARRRGHVVTEKPKPGTPLYIVKAFLPCIDSFGFETDLRTHTQGQAFCLSSFDHWALVPGNPLDSSIVLKPLEPAPTAHLARDFMMKTRRRKGLGEDITISKFFDQELLVQVQEANIDLFQI